MIFAVMMLVVRTPAHLVASPSASDGTDAPLPAGEINSYHTFSPTLQTNHVGHAARASLLRSSNYIFKAPRYLIAL